MKNKRKIWVRIGAFMAALICCVFCVVPAYAEEAEAQTEQGDLIAEQAEKIEGYISSLGYGDLTLTAGEQLEILQKTYADVQSYTWYSSSYAPCGVYSIGSTSTAQSYYNGGFTFVIRDGDGNIVLEREWAALQYSFVSYSNDRLVVQFKQNSTNSTPRLRIEYNNYLSVKAWESVAFSQTYSTSGAYETYYYMADGYSFEIVTWSGQTTLKLGDYAGYLTINPSQLLALNVSASNEEVYNQGYNTGYNEGYTFGYTTGMDEGLESGWWQGHEEGYTNGRDQGYRTGYDDGMHQTSLIEGIKSLFRAPMEFIESVLDFEIFGIDLGDAVKALVSMMLLALVITVVWKAVK